MDAQRSERAVSDNIIKEVFRAMEDAEGMHGPTRNEYIDLMARISAECTTRIRNYIEIQNIKPTMSFEAFQKSGRNVKFVDVGLGDMQTEFGRIYADDYCIELCPDGAWKITVEHDDFTSHNLIDLEKKDLR